MRSLFVAAALMLLVVSTAAVGRGPAFDTSNLKPMIPLKLHDLDGKPFDADRLKGNIIVLDFWATWCGPCIAEIPRLNLMQEQYSERGVKVVGVTLASGSHSDVKPFVGNHNMKYTVLMGDDNQTYDLNIVGYPTTYLITKDWKVYRAYVGTPPGKIQRIEADIQKLLGSE